MRVYSSRLLVAVVLREGIEKFHNLIGYSKGTHPYELAMLTRNMSSMSSDSLIGLIEESFKAVPRGGRKIGYSWDPTKILVLQYKVGDVCFRIRIQFDTPGLLKKIILVVISNSEEKVKLATSKHQGFSEITSFDKIKVSEKSKKAQEETRNDLSVDTILESIMKGNEFEIVIRRRN